MLLITCFIFGLLGSLAWAGPHARSVCPSGTFANRDRSQWYCYKFYEDMATFQEAEEECQYKWRGHLVSFTRDKQAETVGAYINKENTENNHVWIGLQRENLASAWRWTDGSRSKYRKFNSAPSLVESYNEHCAAFSPVYGRLSWSEQDCSSKFPFLCKWKPS
ncbi:lithostathine-1-beta-like [Notechis scutatus]|uniref:Lithostathine-1-beta-like n=1 Tax=Notechis scutatus TaxID=8663 RepID=A0A6J1VVZ4_9SAUR|nr:lithostathine-1-beta-like [Notechis scutatus]XP_026547176.1 lithostathine-1-beta-like [Notechis scutatus]